MSQSGEIYWDMIPFQVLELKKKLELQFQFSTQKPKGDEAAKRFQDEIQKLRVQKVSSGCVWNMHTQKYSINFFHIYCNFFFFFLCFLGTTPVQAQARGRAV